MRQMGSTIQSINDIKFMVHPRMQDLIFRLRPYLILLPFERGESGQIDHLIPIKATARKLAILYYNAITKGMDYVETGVKRYDEQSKQTELLRVNKQARKLGYALNEIMVHQ
jgi:hypothetical protein